MTLKYIWRSFQPRLSFPRRFLQSLACFRVARSPSNSWASFWVWFYHMVNLHLLHLRCQICNVVQNTLKVWWNVSLYVSTRLSPEWIVKEFWKLVYIWTKIWFRKRCVLLFNSWVNAVSKCCELQMQLLAFSRTTMCSVSGKHQLQSIHGSVWPLASPWSNGVYKVWLVLLILQFLYKKT